MPTYDYRCQACGHEFEDFHSISQPPLRKCPKCKKPKLERLIGSGAGILFKGGGFYQTDYRSESYKRDESSDKEGAKPASEPSKTASAAEAKSESTGAKSESTGAKPEPAGAKPASASAKTEAPKTDKGSAKPSGQDGSKGSKKKRAGD